MKVLTLRNNEKDKIYELIKCQSQGVTERIQGVQNNERMNHLDSRSVLIFTSLQTFGGKQEEIQRNEE